MPVPETLRNFLTYLDGVGEIGLCEEGSLPNLELKTEEVQAGGMIAPVDVSMASLNKMEGEFTINSPHPAFIGKIGHADVPLTFRGAVGATNKPVVVEMRCLMTALDFEAWKAGAKSNITVKYSATYIKVTVDGEELVEVDAINTIFKSGGVDHLEGVRKALGL